MDEVMKVFNVLVIVLVICFGLSLLFNGFLYVQTLDLRKEIGNLHDQLDSSANQINELKNQLSELTHTKNFTFELPHLVLGYIRIELTLTLNQTHLLITSKQNYSHAELVLAFDRNGDGKISADKDDAWILYYANNYHRARVDPASGEVIFPMCLPQSSQYHHTVIKEDESIFYIAFPLEMLYNDVIYVSERGVIGHGVLFCFELEV